MTIKPASSMRVLMGFAMTVLLIFAGYYAYELLQESPMQWKIEDIAPKQTERLRSYDRKAMIAGLEAKEKSEQDQQTHASEPSRNAGLNELVHQSLKKLDNHLAQFKPATDRVSWPEGKVLIFF